jgi:DNA gyrase/topoisomerase IV subunit A
MGRDTVTGLGQVEVSLLIALYERAGVPGTGPIKCSHLVDYVADKVNFGQRYSYQVLCDLASPWRVRLPLVDFNSTDMGSIDFPAAAPRFTECSLTDAGRLGALAEKGEIGSVPLGLINGTTYMGGKRPPFSPQGITRALLRICQGPESSDKELLDLVGAPSFPTGCDVSGQVDSLLRVGSGSIVLRPIIRKSLEGGSGVYEIIRLPPEMSALAVIESFQEDWQEDLDEADSDGTDPEEEELVELPPISNLENMSHGINNEIVWFTIDRKLDPEAVLARLRDFPTLTVTIDARMDGPLRDVLRRWIREAGSDAKSALELLSGTLED